MENVYCGYIKSVQTKCDKNDGFYLKFDCLIVRKKEVAFYITGNDINYGEVKTSGRGEVDEKIKVYVDYVGYNHDFNDGKITTRSLRYKKNKATIKFDEVKHGKENNTCFVKGSWEEHDYEDAWNFEGTLTEYAGI